MCKQQVVLQSDSFYTQVVLFHIINSVYHRQTPSGSKENVKMFKTVVALTLQVIMCGINYQKVNLISFSSCDSVGKADVHKIQGQNFNSFQFLLAI